MSSAISSTKRDFIITLLNPLGVFMTSQQGSKSRILRFEKYLSKNLKFKSLLKNMNALFHKNKIEAPNKSHLSLI